MFEILHADPISLKDTFEINFQLVSSRPLCSSAQKVSLTKMASEAQNRPTSQYTVLTRLCMASWLLLISTLTCTHLFAEVANTFKKDPYRRFCVHYCKFKFNPTNPINEHLNTTSWKTSSTDKLTIFFCYILVQDRSSTRCFCFLDVFFNNIFLDYSLTFTMNMHVSKRNKQAPCIYDVNVLPTWNKRPTDICMA